MNQSREIFFCKYKQKQSKNVNLEAITKRLNCNIMQKKSYLVFFVFLLSPAITSASFELSFVTEQSRAVVAPTEERGSEDKSNKNKQYR